jgi:hypothetical protein
MAAFSSIREGGNEPIPGRTVRVPLGRRFSMHQRHTKTSAVADA